jgi:hypothetical protein
MVNAERMCTVLITGIVLTMVTIAFKEIKGATLPELGAL